MLRIRKWHIATVSRYRYSFNGLTQEAYAQKMIDEYKAAGVPPADVFPQSFNKDDVLYWVKS